MVKNWMGIEAQCSVALLEEAAKDYDKVKIA